MQSTSSAPSGPPRPGPGTPERHVPRNRHVPRVCGSCGQPMSGQGDTCWSCGAVWTDPQAATAGTP